MFQKWAARMGRPRKLKKLETLPQNNTPQSNQAQIVLWRAVEKIQGTD